MIPLETFSPADRGIIAAKAAEARRVLLGNIRAFRHYPGYRLLTAGDTYPGIWLEHNQDNLFLVDYDPEAAWDSVRFALDRQRDDGLLSYATLVAGQAAYSHLQSVWPFVRCALEIADKLGRPEADYAAIYRAGCRYDAWLARHRNRSGSGLVEMYCEWDTGHDNDRRVTDGGIPHTCPGNEAANMPDLPVMPILSVDLTAMRYGGLCALAELAGRLGLPADAARHSADAERLLATFRKLCFDPVDDFYYDRAPGGVRKYRTEHITRVFLNRMCPQEEFDRIYTRYFENPEEFMTAFPFPSVSVSDPHFDRACPRNSWGSNSQALTALRAMLWLGHYGRPEERRALLYRWIRALIHPDHRLGQEINPFDGSAPAGGRGGYTPTLLLMLLGAREIIGDA